MGGILSRRRTMTSSVVSALIFTLMVASVVANQRAAENRLMTSLLANYNSMFIPVLNSSVPIVVNMETMLKKIVEYDYERGILTSLVWLDFQWMDEYNAGQLDLRPNIDTMDLEDYTG